MATYYYECAVQGLPRQYSAITESTAQGQTTPCIMGLAALVSLLAINVPVITGPPSNKGRRTRLPVAGQDVIQLNRLQPTTAAGHDVIQHNRLQPMTDAVNHETLANIAEAVDRNASKIYSDKDSGKDIQFRAPNNSVESLFDD
ncbi:hypothetical protein JR316_0006374 [Psilocybe cubensis]|uniref:Uncharacterized protein n=8 Tax=Psilocybe cubensis TaxID=181762 RepID=A0A8H7XKD4_PSICU|nr:hypothetical protein JR316_0010533 [Psilocybe cubensis]XP_047747910.1 hypothetical protein JR316_0006883 [Psilocybe cubensis]XP_047747916.1 hypothetical protein JR316_0006889 [Psilocybe cubensis]XP_047748111.1 hypothetical protein JR316_0007086 [Psilocybe cubensis]XP_047748114.1 hypothetical protein JR316_0007089 [Psilocybe cubensis]XP_047749437.1 hypothetical protein JR316_0006339 [Psilocybe cubensis]XP_047749469.1 hypothetical protein JR316_0006374 [Psilocybe cubensis]KAH9476620.1 hypot